jgi:hypothetical protein
LRDDLEQHARLAGEDVAGHDLRHLLDLFAQGLGARPLDLQPREGRDAEPNRAPVENRAIG